jgi:hypothetical protein
MDGCRVERAATWSQIAGWYAEMLRQGAGRISWPWPRSLIDDLAERSEVSGEGMITALRAFDLTSAWMEGRHRRLAARGYSRHGKPGKAQIEYGEGRRNWGHQRPQRVR